MKASLLRLILSLVLITICISCPQCGVSAQTVSWTSSNPDIVSVDENTGAIEMVSEPDATTNVTITATITLNGKTTTSAKTVEVQTNSYPGCSSPNMLVGNIWWAACNVGAGDPHACSSTYYLSIDRNQCPSGWRLPSQNELNALKATGAVWTAQGGINGALYGNRIFFPACGYKHTNDYNPSTAYAYNSRVNIWTSTQYYGWDAQSGNLGTYWKPGGSTVDHMNIRCVKSAT